MKVIEQKLEDYDFSNELPRLVKFALKYGFFHDFYIGHYQFQSWTGSLPFYAF